MFLFPSFFKFTFSFILFQRVCLSVLKWRESDICYFSMLMVSPQQVLWFTSENCLEFYLLFTYLNKILLETCHFYRETCLSCHLMLSPCHDSDLSSSTWGRAGAAGFLQVSFPRPFCNAAACCSCERSHALCVSTGPSEQVTLLVIALH